MGLNIYTATKWERREEMARWNDVLRDRGHRITHDWTVWEENNPTADVGARRHAAGMLDYAGVMNADLLIYWDHPQANGARWEAGIAVGAGIPVWIVEYKNDVIFDVLPLVRTFDSWDGAILTLERSTALV